MFRSDKIFVLNITVSTFTEECFPVIVTVSNTFQSTASIIKNHLDEVFKSQLSVLLLDISSNLLIVIVFMQEFVLKC